MLPALAALGISLFGGAEPSCDVLMPPLYDGANIITVAGDCDMSSLTAVIERDRLCLTRHLDYFDGRNVVEETCYGNVLIGAWEFAGGWRPLTATSGVKVLFVLVHRQGPPAPPS